MRTVVYMMVQYEECITSISDLCPATLSPVFECGPDGLQFQVCIYLFFITSLFYYILLVMHQLFSEMFLYMYKISFALFSYNLNESSF